MKKRSFTLLETLFALSLITLILTSLFSFLHSHVTLAQKIDTVKKEILHRAHLEQRLSLAFSKMEECVGPLLEKEINAFYTEEEALYFAFNNGPDPEEVYTGIVLAKLFIEDHNLYFEMWPADENTKTAHRKELLAKGATNLSFVFYKRPSILNKTEETFETKTSWPIDLPDIPYLMRISISFQNEKQRSYSYSLPSKIPPIHYPNIQKAL